MDSLQKISNDLVQLINEKEKKKPIPYDTYAKVIRIDGGTAWVHIPGGVDETPVAMTVNAKVGDSVLVRVSGGNAWITGNSSAPPTDDTTANRASHVAGAAQSVANDAHKVAASADTKASKAYDAAEAVYELAETANTNAEQARISANGKNKIYRQTSQPSSGMVAGDVWFDSDDGNKIYRYNGTSWVAVELGNDAIASLSANKLTAGTIDASVITVSNIDAGNITTGTIDANRIDASKLTIGGSGLATTANVDTAEANAVSTAASDATSKANAAESAAISTAASDATTKANAAQAAAESTAAADATAKANAAQSAAISAAASDATTKANAAEANAVSTAAADATTKANAAAKTATNYITAIDSDGIRVHASNNPTKNYALINADGLQVYKSGTQVSSFGADEATLGGNKASLRYSEDGSAFGLQNSHRVVLAKATDESGVRNDATLSSRKISTWDQTKPMGFVNVNHYTDGSTKYGEAGMYTWGGDSYLPRYVVLRNGNGSGADYLEISSGNLSLDTSGLILNTGIISASNITTDEANIAELQDDVTTLYNNKADKTGFFKVVDLSWTEPAIKAHSNGTNTTHTVASANRPAGMALVGIVGWQSSNYRLYPYVFHTNGAHSISVTMANATAANSASATVHAYLLYIKATSA